MAKERDIPFITSSILNNYIGCKFSFLDFYKHGGYETYRNNDEDGEPIYLAFGTLMHGVIEQFWKSPLTRTKQFLVTTYENDIATSGFTDKGYIELGYQIIDNFFSYLLYEAPKRKLLHSELSFKVTIGGIPLHGTIDAIFYHGNGIYEIEDYKTSNFMPTQAEVDENIQLTMYDLVFSDDSMSEYWFHGIKPKGIILTLHYLRHDKRIQTERTEFSRLSALNYFRLIYKQMKVLSDDKFVPTLNKFCTYCDCAERCPLYQSVLDDTYTPEKQKDVNENNLYLYEDYKNRIKILESEANACYNEVFDYLSIQGVPPIELDGYEYYLSQGGRRYVKKDKAIEVLTEHGLWDEKLQKQCCSISVGTMEHIINENPDIEQELQKVIGYSYNSPSLTSRKLPKLFKRSRSKKQ